MNRSTWPSGKPRSSHFNASSRQLVIRWRAHDPHSTATEIALGLTEAGHRITRQRVRQILEAEGLPLRPKPRPREVPSFAKRSA